MITFGGIDEPFTNLSQPTPCPAPGFSYTRALALPGRTLVRARPSLSTPSPPFFLADVPPPLIFLRLKAGGGMTGGPTRWSNDARLLLPIFTLAFVGYVTPAVGITSLLPFMQSPCPWLRRLLPADCGR